MTPGKDAATQRTVLVVSTALGEVSVRVTGQLVFNSPALLLLHANPGDSRDFDAVLPVLEREFTVVTIDWPGYGQSTVTDPSRVSAEGLVTVAEQVLGALTTRGIHRLAVIGSSVGGFVAFMLANRCPDSIAGIALVDPGGFTPQNVITRAFCRQVMGQPAVARRLVAPLARAYLGRRRTASAQATYGRARHIRHDSQRLEVHCALWRSFTDPAFDLTARSCPEPAVPALLIWGRRDPVVPAAVDGRRARRALPHADSVLLSTGHEPYNEQPQAFLDVILPFLRTHAGHRRKQ